MEENIVFGHNFHIDFFLFSKLFASKVTPCTWRMLYCACKLTPGLVQKRGEDCEKAKEWINLLMEMIHAICYIGVNAEKSALGDFVFLSQFSPHLGVFQFLFPLFPISLVRLLFLQTSLNIFLLGIFAHAKCTSWVDFCFCLFFFCFREKAPKVGYIWWWWWKLAINFHFVCFLHSNISFEELKIMVISCISYCWCWFAAFFSYKLFLHPAKVYIRRCTHK